MIKNEKKENLQRIVKYKNSTIEEDKLLVKCQLLALFSSQKTSILLGNGTASLS